LFGTIQDITERKQAEEARSETLARFSGFAEASQYGMGIADLEGNIIYVNPTLARMLGEKSAEDCQGKHFPTAYYPPVMARRLQEVVLPALTRDGQWHGELELLSADGRRIPTDENFFVIRNEQGHPRYIADILTDITERKRAEEAIRTSEAQLSNALRMAHAGHWEYDVASDTFTFNDNFYRIFRTTAEEVGGYTMPSAEYARRFCHPDDMHMVRQETEAAIKTDDPYYGRELEHRILFPNGEVGYVAVRFFIVKDSEGRTVRTYGVNQDITERKKSEESLRQSEAQLRRALREAINSLSSAIEMRDPYTAGHQEQVAKLAVAIGREMGISEDSIEALQIAGIVHDIGKLSVPAEILSKPTRLTEIEFQLVRTHAEIGFSILNKISFPWPIAQIVGQHHERIDGSGYPKGLKGNELFTEAKILGVADTVEAMSSHRPYRPALGIEVALKEVKEKRGILYDSEVVEACLKIFAENTFRF
jgi:PAS domain S-box-containing protein/putative nucleotidyltransferase with HDIG domain